MLEILQDGGDFYVMENGEAVHTYSTPFIVSDVSDAELARMWFRRNTYHGANTCYRFLEA